MSLDCRIELTTGTVTVIAEGEIGLDTVDVFRDMLCVAVQGQCGGRIDLDMRGVTFVDSLGIGALAAARSAAAGRGTDLIIHEPSRAVRLALQAARLNGLSDL